MKNVLVAIDFSDVTDKVVATASLLARQFDGKLCVVHAESPYPDLIDYEHTSPTARHGAAAEIKKHHRALSELHEKLEADGFDVKCMHLQGATACVIAEEARRFDADVIVIGSHEHGAFYRLLLGSVENSLVAVAPCPVLVVPGHLKKGSSPN